MLRTIILSILIFNGSQLIAQIKWEREYRIHPSIAPENATRFIDSARLVGRVKWYAEESHEGKTYEAKFKLRNKNHSVEFSESGHALDIEVELKRSELSDSWVMSFDKTLSEDFTKLKIVKVQIQYIETLLEYLRKGSISTSRANYEVVIRGYKGRDFKFYEVTIDSVGALISSKEIVTRNTDNLEF